MSSQPRNTKIMRREGPWGQAGWFRSRYLTLTDATAGCLERSSSYPLPLCSILQRPPPHSPRPGSIEVLTGQAQADRPLSGTGKEKALGVVVTGRESSHRAT